MSKTSLILTAAAAAALLATGCENDKPRGPGRPGMGGDRGVIFERLDVNNDGVVTRREFMNSPRAQQNPQQAAQAFARMDRQNNGSLTRREFVAGPW